MVCQAGNRKGHDRRYSLDDSLRGMGYRPRTSFAEGLTAASRRLLDAECISHNRTTRPQQTPASRPRLPRGPDRPGPAGIPRRLTPPAAITYRNHEPACAFHQPSHTPQLDSKFKIPAGKDNLPIAGLRRDRYCGLRGVYLRHRVL